MESSTTITKMLAGNTIFVPTYQRAYSWDTSLKIEEKSKQVNVFFTDLEDYNNSLTVSPYYFGHFLFEEKDTPRFAVIDGQQRLTTIMIFLSVLFKKLEILRPLNEIEITAKEDLIIRRFIRRFETVDYDDQLFQDYVIKQLKIDSESLETQSAKKIVKAFDFFMKKLEGKSEAYLVAMLETIQQSSCTTHSVKNESEAIQMFIFQNGRGKKPSVLELIKAQFMFNVHLNGGDEKEVLIGEIKCRFEKIYKAIASINYNIDEDDILAYTLRVHFNSLRESNSKDKIDENLTKQDSIAFIKSFTYSLGESFRTLSLFFGIDERENMAIHSLISLGGFGIGLPFVIKAYRFGLNKNDICHLCINLESLILRQRLVGTRADIVSRINEVYQGFTFEQPSIEPIIKRIQYLKNVSSDSGWDAHWNNNEFVRSIQGPIESSTAKFLLWKYEHHLNSLGKSGYIPIRFDSIVNCNLEHIAPQTPTKSEPIAAGYCEYDDEFKEQYLNCLGNYLLLSGGHNKSIGNIPFKQKLDTYTILQQHIEIQSIVANVPVWNKDCIRTRKDKIISFLSAQF